MFTVLIVFHVLLAIALIAIVLLQRGPGATMGAAFGAGASGTVFGSRGAGSFLTRLTTWLAIGFFSISLAMAVLAARSTSPVPQEDLGVAGRAVELQTAPEPAPSADEAAIPEPESIPDETGEDDWEAPEPPVD